jgi:antimicrobial peptide system SdpB family protein
MVKINPSNTNAGQGNQTEYIMQQLLTSFESYLQQLVAGRPLQSWVIGLGRSVLAIGTLLTLCTNQVSLLIYQTIDGNYFNPILQTSSVFRDANFFLILGHNWIWVMQTLAILSLVAVITGYWQRLTSILHWWVCSSFMFLSSALDGGDQIAAILSLLFIPICWFDTRKNHWHSNPGQESTPFYLIPMAFFTLIRLQVAIIYFEAAVGKFKVEEWANGTAVYYWLEHSLFGMPQWLKYITMPVLTNPIGITLITYGVLLFEILLFLAFTMPRLQRKHILLPGIIFHFGIVLYHGIFSFFFSITAGLIIYLLPVTTPAPKFLTQKINRIFKGKWWPQQGFKATQPAIPEVSNVS